MGAKYKRLVTLEECEKMRGACQELTAEKRGRITDELKAMRREQRLGFTFITIFLTIIGILIRTGVI